LLNQNETVKFLRISLVTLTDWDKKKVFQYSYATIYFTEKKVKKYIWEKNLHLKAGSKLHHLKNEIDLTKISLSLENDNTF